VLLSGSPTLGYAASIIVSGSISPSRTTTNTVAVSPQERLFISVWDRPLRNGYGSSVLNYRSMQDLLNNTGLPIPLRLYQEYKSLQDYLDPLHPMHRKVFFVDTEWNHTAAREIAVSDAAGNFILDCFVTYADYPDILAVHETEEDFFGRLYGPAKKAIRVGLAMTPIQVAKVLSEAGMDSDSIIIEFSYGAQDHKRLAQVLALAGRLDVLPDREKVMSPLSAWYTATPGLRAHTQSFLYLLTTNDNVLYELAHRAGSDVKMLISTTLTFLRYMRLNEDMRESKRRRLTVKPLVEESRKTKKGAKGKGVDSAPGNVRLLHRVS
jgi:hypothetical protein